MGQQSVLKTKKPQKNVEEHCSNPNATFILLVKSSLVVVVVVVAEVAVVSSSSIFIDTQFITGVFS